MFIIIRSMMLGGQYSIQFKFTKYAPVDCGAANAAKVGIFFFA